MPTALNAMLLGGIAGAVVCAGVGMRWSGDLAHALSDPVATTWLSAFGGTIIGGGISYFIARQASRETLQRDDDARANTEHASSLRAIVTAMQITNRLYTLNKSLETAVAMAGEKEPWQFMLASAGWGSVAPTFEAGDFIPFIKNGHADVVHRATLASEKLASTEAAMDLYSSKRQAFQQFAERNTTIDSSGMSSSLFKGEDAAVAQLKAFELNQLFNQLVESSREYLADAQKLCTDMNASHQSYFGKKAGFTFGLDKDANTSASAHPD